MIEPVPFLPYGKTPRLNRNMIITEKIDGTNAGIGIRRLPKGTSKQFADWTTVVPDPDDPWNFDYMIWCQSRNRVITPDSDNAGFARWVHLKGQALTFLGEGMHFGEWYGPGIQGNKYNLPGQGKRLALFNVDRWKDINFGGLGLSEVNTAPVLFRGPFSTLEIDWQVTQLKRRGSRITPGAPAEGVIVYLPAARQVFKVLCEGDEIPKSVRDAA